MYGTPVNLTNISILEDVDAAVYNWVNESLNISCTTTDGFTKVPVIWTTPERSFQIKNNKELRDINGTINPPLIAIERTSISKDAKNNGIYYANLPPNLDVIQISRKINQDKTSKFSNAANARSNRGFTFLTRREPKKVVYEYTTIMAPVYVIITYNINIFTNYMQQMNEITHPFLTRPGSTRYVLIEKDGYKYEVLLDPKIENKNNLNNLEQEERKYNSTITLNVLGNINSEGSNEPDKVIKTYENAVDVKFPKE